MGGPKGSKKNKYFCIENVPAGNILVQYLRLSLNNGAAGVVCCEGRSRKARRAQESRTPPTRAGAWPLHKNSAENFAKFGSCSGDFARAGGREMPGGDKGAGRDKKKAPSLLVAVKVRILYMYADIPCLHRGQQSRER